MNAESRPAYRFGEGRQVLEATNYLTTDSRDFRRCVRTLRAREKDRSWSQRSPAPAAGLADHVRSLAEWLTRPAVPSK